MKLCYRFDSRPGPKLLRRIRLLSRESPYLRIWRHRRQARPQICMV